MSISLFSSNQGYGYKGDGKTCSDIDECANDPCHKDANCNNFDGGYLCACKTGYTGDGKSCSGKKIKRLSNNLL